MEDVIEQIQLTLPTILIEKYDISSKDVSVEKIGRNTLEVIFVSSDRNDTQAEFNAIIDEILSENVQEFEFSLSNNLEKNIRELSLMELEIDHMKDSKLEILEQQLSVAKRLGITNPEVEKTPFGPTWFIESSVFLYGTKHINGLIEGLKNSRSSASSVDLLIKIKSKHVKSARP